MEFKSHLLENPLFSVAAKVAEASGVKLYVVGGYVRDLILQRKRDEIDFLVIGSGTEYASALAKELKVNKIAVYKNFGTAHFRYGDLDLEFVGARRESYNRMSRKPVVEEGSFEDDIKRRDFTINTLVISLNRENFGEVLDSFEGLKDIERRIIRTPLDPFITFSDDPLRIMRAVRFASQLNFELDETVRKAAGEMAGRLQIISQERITDEFLKILMSQKPSVGLKILFETGIMRIIIPEIANLAGIEQRKDYHHKDVFLHTCTVVDNISEMTDNPWLRFAALMHDVAKPQTKKFVEGIGWTFHGHEEAGARMMEEIFHRLRLPLTKLEYVTKLIRLHLRPIALVDEEVTDSAIRRLIVAAGEDLEDLITLCRADITSKNIKKVSRYLANYEKVMNKVRDVKEKDRLRAFQSPVRGEEIMQICNLKPSKKVGEIKKAIEDAILDGKIGNSYQEAYDYLMKIKEDFL
ncbi:MAG: HD domain-containing protein [Ignavibacteria bacterium]|jgi:tRNA nucleotidyltransferase/poly(A) polymerase|nr:HD domain-containing protein [Ignavibacteria bacterium]MCU7505048.1 HD domain-containing protein [Ignavibacteria bacterium]MCU7515312.1 HD domain-containing protein [Ignavibacteria bacterium]